MSDGEGANGGFHWVVVGNGLSGTLDTSGTHSSGKCGESQANEEQCSLNHDPTANAEKPQVAAGTMNPANPTVPWVAWDEEVAGVKQVFVSHLVGSGATAHFELANGGKPLSAGPRRRDAARHHVLGQHALRDLREDVGGSTDAVVGHFANPASFVTDSNGTRSRRRPRRTSASRSPRAASRRRSTATGRPARAARSGRRSS